MTESAPPASEPSWKVLVAYINHGPDSPDPSEDWSFFVDDLRSATTPHGIVVVEAVNLEPSVPVVIDGNLVARIELGPFRAQANQGYVFARSGTPPAFSPYDQVGQTLAAASAYFEADLRR